MSSNRASEETELRAEDVSVSLATHPTGKLADREESSEVVGSQTNQATEKRGAGNPVHLERSTLRISPTFGEPARAGITSNGAVPIGLVASENTVVIGYPGLEPIT